MHKPTFVLENMLPSCPVVACQAVPSTRRPPRLVIRATIWPPAAGGMLGPVPSSSHLFLDRPTVTAVSQVADWSTSGWSTATSVSVLHDVQRLLNKQQQISLYPLTFSISTDMVIFPTERLD